MLWCLGLAPAPVRCGSGEYRPPVAFFATPQSANFLSTGLGGYVGVGYTHAWQTPLSGHEGDRWQLGSLGLFYRPTRWLLLLVRGGLYQRLGAAKRQAAPRILLSGDSLHDVEDFEVHAVVLLWSGGAGRRALSFRLGMRLPNTNQHQGMGTNTSDLFFSLHWGMAVGRVQLILDGGVGILTAPLETNSQNDVALYGAAVLWPVGRDVWLGAEVNGFFTTRHVIPAGTESRGVARLGGHWQRGAAGLEVYGQIGLTRRSGKLGGGLLLTWWLPW
ncbi:MAG: hypothetical protein D6715_03785 [Calditrichaeota bacterium]|nr:MAG: hypothetical protein D6715_03785 [Calditrichota bacterium]